jgi:hypothetical protein
MLHSSLFHADCHWTTLVLHTPFTWPDPQSYNPNMDIFGVVRLTFSWLDSGVITMTADIAGLPAAANAVSGWVGKSPCFAWVLSLLASISCR